MQRTVIRQMDEVGRIVLPRDFKNALAWETETKVAIQLDGNKMVLFAETGLCFLCEGKENLREVKDRYICKTCIAELSSEQTL